MDTPSHQKKASLQSAAKAIPESKIMLHGGRFDVHRLELMRNGKKTTRDVVIHPGAVSILPILNDSQIVMIRNSRFAVGKMLWEIPAGTLEPNEAPLETAKRELIEETGYSGKEFELLTIFYTSPGFCNEVMHAYVAKQLTYEGQKLEDSEEISVEVVKWKDALKMIENNEICDGKTIASLLYYRQFRLK